MSEDCTEPIRTHREGGIRGRPVAGGGQALSSNSSRPISIRRISEVPAPIS